MVSSSFQTCFDEYFILFYFEHRPNICKIWIKKLAEIQSNALALFLIG